MRIRVDRRSEVALFRQVARQVRLALASGEVRAGQRLPGARELARYVGVSVSVVAQAMAELEREGVVETRDRVGVFVTAGGVERSRVARVRRLVAGVDGLLGEAEALGFGVDEVVRVLRARAADG